MEAENRRKIEETVLNILKRTDLERTTEFAVRATASQHLGIDLSDFPHRKLVRDVVESFLLYTTEKETAPEEKVNANASQEAVQEAPKKEVDSQGDRVICKLASKRNVVVQEYKGKNFVSIRDFYHKDGNHRPSYKGIHLPTDQWITLRKNIHAIDEAIMEMQSKQRSNLLGQQNQQISSSVTKSDEESVRVSTSTSANGEQTQPVSTVVTANVEQSHPVSTSLTANCLQNQLVSTAVTAIVEQNQQVYSLLTATDEQTQQVSTAMTTAVEQNQQVFTAVTAAVEQNQQVSAAVNATGDRNLQVSTSVTANGDRSHQVSTSMTANGDRSHQVSTSVIAKGDLNQLATNAVTLNHEDNHQAFSSATPEFVPIEINRFDGKNYQLWASKMELFLRQLDIAYVLSDPSPSAAIIQETSNNDNAQVKATEQKWFNDDYLCRHNILNSLSDSLYHKYSKNAKTAKELWEEVKSVYCCEEFESKRSQVKKYIEFRMVDEKSILDQVQELNSIADSLVASGYFLDENFHVSAIISKFPHSWKDFCIKLMREEYLPFWLLMDRVKVEEVSRSPNKQGQSSDSVYSQHSKNLGPRIRDMKKPGMHWKRQTETDSKSLFCNFCKKKGHSLKQCRYYKEGDERQYKEHSSMPAGPQVTNEHWRR